MAWGLSESGGLVYHWRAFRYRSSRWRGFIDEVHAWLMDWSKNLESHQELIVFGMSAGHCLKDEFLQQFARIVAIDLDEFAPVLFRLRHRKISKRVHWLKEDFLKGDRHSFDRLEEFLCQHSGAVLFNNLLGQLFLDSQIEIQSQFGKQLQEALKGKSWASIHDRLSGEIKPNPLPKNWNGKELLGASNKDLVHSFYSDQKQKKELLDHRTEAWFSEQEPCYWSWEVRPGYFHLIEGVRSN